MLEQLRVYCYRGMNNYADYFTKLLRVILDTKYVKADLNKVMKNQCQNLTETPHNELLKLLQNFEELFDGTLGIWKTDPVHFELK